jgi:hypothetical protein
MDLRWRIGADPAELLRCLGVERSRGTPTGDPNAWFTVLKRICDLDDAGMKPERAIATVAAELVEKYSRSQFQNLRDAYRAAWHVAQNPE